MTETNNPTQVLLIIALLLMVLRWIPLPRLTGRLLGVALLLMTPLFPGCETNTQPAQSPKAQFEYGLQAAQTEKTATALEAFNSAAARLDGKQRAAALYNQGTLLLTCRRPDEAITLFEQALILVPGDKEIRDNLMFALAKSEKITTDGQGMPESQASEKGQEMSRQQAQRLLDSVQLDPTAPPSEATSSPPTVLKEW